MAIDDLQILIERLDRVSGAIGIGCEAMHRVTRPAVAAALEETCWEGIRLGHALARGLAQDDLWSDLDLLVHCWRRIEMQTGDVRAVHHEAGGALDVAREVVAALESLARAVAEIDSAQVEVAARPRDVHAVRRVLAAIRDMEETADRFFMTAVTADAHGRLDAAMALLTSIAARAARERTSAGSRRS